jgi:RHS repeat-associated protein
MSRKLILGFIILSSKAWSANHTTYYPTGTNPVLPNSYGRSYHWLPNKNILDENGEGKFTIFDSLINIKVEKHFAYNDLSTDYIDNVERSPNHNALYKTKLNQIKSTLTADVQSEINTKKQKSLGKLSTATSYDYLGNINEIVSTTYNADELPENEYHYARFQPYLGGNGYTKRFLLNYKDYNLAGKPAEVELLEHNPGGSNSHVYSTKSSFNTLGHLTQLQFKQGASATNFTNLADYSYHLPSGKLTQVDAHMPSFSLATTYTYDSRERLTKIDNSMFEENLYYDNNFPSTGIGTNVANYNGNINGVYTHHKGCAGLDPLTYQYHYDAANRLSRAFSDAKMIPSGADFGSQVFSYLRNGSMQSFTTEELNPGFMSTALRTNYFHYFTGTNKLEKISPTAGGNVTAPFTTNNRSFTYDKNGNLASDALRDNNFLYDRANLPYRVYKGNTTYAFGYNTADARIFKGNDNQAYYYLAGSVYDMKNDEWEHYPGGLAVHKNGNLNLIIKDHLTNTRAVVDVNDGCSGPAYQAQYDFYPYSKILRKLENPRSRFQSTDHETDIETGYNNRNARWYDDESFNFLQTDPLSDKFPSWNPYHYVARNPIILTDPTGMSWYLSNDKHEYKWFEGSDEQEGYTYERTGDITLTYQDGKGNSMSATLMPDGSICSNMECTLGKTVDFYGMTISTKGATGEFSERAHETLDAAGYVDPSFICDGLNGIIYSLEGQKTYAGICFGAAFIPYAGDAGKIFKSTIKQAAEGGVKYSDELVNAAQQLYPNKAGKIELHHPIPQYLGGARNQNLVPLDAAYHQVITNEFRILHGYGLARPSSERLQEIIKEVYSKYPLPGK